MELTRGLHRGLSVDLIAPHVSFPVNSDASFTKWANKHIADDGLEASPFESNSRKLMLNNVPSARHSNLQLCQIGCDFFRLGHDLHALPPKKLRKLLTTFADGMHVFSCVEKVSMPTCMDLEWPDNRFDCMHHPLLGKKRPWHLCRVSSGGHDSADVNMGLFGGGNFLQMLGKTDVLQNEEHFSVHGWGSGGSSNGGRNGEGGGGHGDDSGGSQQPDFDGREVPISMNWIASTEEQEDAATRGKPANDDLNIPENLCGNVNAMMLRNRLDVLDDFQSGRIYKEACGLHDAPRQVLCRIQEDLDKVLSQFFLEFERIKHLGDGVQDLMWQHNVHKSAAYTAQTHDHVEFQNELQDTELALADESIAADIKGNSNSLLDKLRGLTLGVTERRALLSPIQTEKLQTFNFKEVTDVDGKASTLFAKRSTPKMDDQSRSALKADEAQNVASGQLQGVVNWLDRLSLNVPGKHRADFETLEGQVEDQKLRSMVNEAVATALKQQFDADGAPPPAKQADTETLKRLQREVFSELLRLREKLDQVASSRHSDNARHFSGAGKTNLQGEVKVGMAVVMLEDSSSRHSRGSLEQAGMQTGVDVKLTFETPFRQKDLLITECVAGQGSSVGEGRALGGPMSLGKVQYLAHINDDISVSFVPMGAHGMDATDIVNPMQDQGLTSFSSRGPALFDHCKGSAIGATWSGSSFALSAAHYLSGWGNQPFSLGTDARESGPLCLSTLGQLLLQPTERLIFSLSGLNRFWPSPPLPSSMGLHWSEMGPLVIPKIHSLQTSRSTMSSDDSFLSHCNSMSSHWGGMLESEYHLDPPESKGTSQLSVAVATEMEISENVSLGAWAQADDVLQDLDKGNFQWAVNLAKTSKNGMNWGASIGGSRPDIWSILTSEQETYPGYVGGVGDAYGPQLHMEAFVRLNCGKGFTLQPGLLYLLNKHSRTPAFVVRSSWVF